MGNSKNTRKLKIIFLFFIITLGFFVFSATLLYIASAPRTLPKTVATESNSALRGSIISKDGFTLSSSKKLYKAVVDTRNIDPGKKDLFIKLFSIYSKSSQKEIKKRLNSYFGHVILSYKLDSKTAKRLKELARKLYRLGVFVTYEDPRTSKSFLHGLSIVESGEYRSFPNGDILTPVVGYIKKVEKNGITKVKGVKGLEEYYEQQLSPIQDSMITGPKDVANNIILNRESKIIKRIDGYSIHHNIPLKLQKAVENILDIYKKELDSDEIIAAVMESGTGKILTLASSNRFNPNSISKKDYPALNILAVEYAYEPGSVIKPITFALLLKKKKINPYDLVRTYRGRYKIGKKVITDTHKYEWLSAEDTIVHSSNIGMAQLAQKLTPIEFYKGLKSFGFSQKSGIDLLHEHSGDIPSLQKFKSKIYKATAGYGYGMRANFIQLMKAYNVFNNNGKMVTPYIANYFSNSQKLFKAINQKDIQTLPISVAKRVQKILIKTVNKGTGKNAQIDGLVIGGKTGTAHIAKSGRYENSYNSSFFGFANDKSNHYTIGVLVKKPKKRNNYFASQTAVPIFREIVEELIENGYLKQEIE